jgi:hypothetical protein
VFGFGIKAAGVYIPVLRHVTSCDLVVMLTDVIEGNITSFFPSEIFCPVYQTTRRHFTEDLHPKFAVLSPTSLSSSLSNSGSRFI